MRAARSLKSLHTPDSLPDVPDSPTALSPKFLQGDLVRIRSISEEEAQRVFKASGIHWNSSKAQLLGTLGELRSVASDYYAVYTPDKSDWWRWPLAMLEKPDGTAVRRCDSPEGPFFEGQLVKILAIKEEDAEQLCLAWSAALSPIVDWTWPDHEAVFSPRELITIDEDASRSTLGWTPSMAVALGRQGRVEAVFRQRCRVATDEGCFWWPFSALEALRCPEGHALEEACAVDASHCANCSCLLEDKVARCEACRLDFCPSCGDQELRFRSQGFVEGAVVRMTTDDAEIDWASCPGGSMSFSRGHRFTIQSLHGCWFASVESSGLMAPLGAAQVVKEEEYIEEFAYREGCDEDRPIKEVRAMPGRGFDEEWASTSTEEGLDLKNPIFTLAARDSCRITLCEPCWNFCQAADGMCPMCRQQSTGAVEAFRERWDVQRPQSRNGGDGSPLAGKSLQEDVAQRKVAWPQGMAFLAEQAKCCEASNRQGTPVEDLLQELQRQRDEISQLKKDKEALERLLAEKM